MKSGDKIRIITESNGATIDAYYVNIDPIALYYNDTEDRAWMRPWHAIRAVELVTVGEQAREEVRKKRSADA